MENRPVYRLDAWMKIKDISRTQLAFECGVSVNSIDNAKAGKKISRDIAVKIADALSVRLDQIEGLHY